MEKTFLKKTDTSKLPKAIESNFYNFLIDLSKEAKRIIHIDEDLKWVINRPSAWPNYIFDVHFDKSDVEGRIKKLIKLIENEDAQSEIVIGPNSKPKDLLKYLEKYNFKINEQEPGMFVDILNLNHFSYNNNVFNIKIVEDKKDIDSWVNLSSAIFFENSDAIEKTPYENLLFKENSIFFVAIMDNKVVGTSLLYLSSGVAGVWFVTTDPNYRNNGIGTALTIAPLLKAKSMGYFIGILLATHEGYPVYKKIGFKECCSFKMLKFVKA